MPQPKCFNHLWCSPATIVFLFASPANLESCRVFPPNLSVGLQGFCLTKFEEIIQADEDVWFHFFQWNKHRHQVPPPLPLIFWGKWKTEEKPSRSKATKEKPSKSSGSSKKSVHGPGHCHGPTWLSQEWAMLWDANHLGPLKSPRLCEL